MSAESNVGVRLLIIGKDGVIAGLREVQSAAAQLNATIAAGADASKTAAAGYDVQMAGLAKLGASMDLYSANLAAVSVETEALAKVGKVAFFTLAAAGAAWGYESIKWAQQYQSALLQLQTQAGLTAKATSAIGAAAKANAAALAISPTAYVQAAYHPASAGFGATTVRDSIAITNAAAKLANIGTVSHPAVETTVNALTGVMKSYNLRGSQATATAAKLNAIIGAGNMHIATLNSALASGVASTANTFGVSLTSLGGALAFLTDRGVPASQAGTHLRMTLALLGAPSAKAVTIEKQAGLSTTQIESTNNSMSQMLQEAGVTVTQLGRALHTNKGKGGIYNALALLKKDLTDAGLTKQMQGAMISRSFGGGRMGTTIEAMYNSVSTLGVKTTRINQASSLSRFQKDWQKTEGTFTFQLRKLGASLEGLGTSFGQKLLPPLTKFLELLTKMFGWLGKNKEVLVALAGIVTAVLVPAIGLYLKRAFLSANGSIMTVVRGYQRLITGQSEEQTALQRTQAQLGETTAATDGLVAADDRLAGAAGTAAGAINADAAAAARATGADDANALAADQLAGADDLAAGGALRGAAGAGLGALGGAAEGDAALGALGPSALTGIMTGDLKSTAGSLLGKAGLWGMGATLEASLFNSTLKKPLTKAVGARGETDISDALTGATMGMMFGPEGALLGAGLGALYGERGHLKQDAHNVVHGLDAARHEAAHLGDDVLGFFGIGGSSSAPRKVLPARKHLTASELATERRDREEHNAKFTTVVHVYIDGKEVTKNVRKRVKADVALSG